MGNSLGGLIAFIGGIGVLIGAWNLLGFSDDTAKNNDWKKITIRIIGGLAVVLIGILMKHFGI
jgi:hypothetical protein